MALGSDWYPDDGSVFFEDITLPQRGLSWYTPFAVTDSLMTPVLYREAPGSWSADDPGGAPPFVGAWGSVSWTAERLIATASKTVEMIDDQVEVLAETYSNERYFAAYPIPGIQGTQWRYLRIRWALRTRTYRVDEFGATTLQSESIAPGDEWLAYNPTAGPGYIAEDPLTWPRFSMIQITPPAAPEPPSPPDNGLTTSAFTRVELVFGYPAAGSFWLAGSDGTVAFGGIPGGYAFGQRYNGVRISDGFTPI